MFESKTALKTNKLCRFTNSPISLHRPSVHGSPARSRVRAGSRGGSRSPGPPQRRLQFSVHFLLTLCGNNRSTSSDPHRPLPRRVGSRFNGTLSAAPEPPCQSRRIAIQWCPERRPRDRPLPRRDGRDSAAPSVRRFWRFPEMAEQFES